MGRERLNRAILNTSHKITFASHRVSGSGRPVCQDCALCSPSDRSIPMTEQTTPMRQRMIEDMTIRNMSPSTQKIYVRAVANFSIFHRRSPDKLSFEDVRDY